MGKSITVVICLDDEGGMTVFGKRQSRDRVLIEELCESVSAPIYVNTFSSFLFRDRADRVHISDDPLGDCPDGGVAFIENLPLLPHIDDIGTVILYKWNRLYPSDVKIDISFDGFRVESRKDFVGSSHERITKIIMTKRR
ncbi:MAG: ribonuclease Z [Clostridia bacterium]|nr:ribonuclease Z [Clostridia bacterium]